MRLSSWFPALTDAAALDGALQSGYALELAHEAGTHAPIAAEREYLSVLERGAFPPARGETPRMR